MDSTLFIELGAIFVLVLANGFFALAEFSVIASRRSKLKQLRQQNMPGAAAAEELREKPERFLAAIQIGITLFGTLAGVVGGATVVVKLERALEALPINSISSSASWLAVAIVAILITMFSVTIGELVPKFLALSAPEKYARHLARPLRLFINLISVLPRSLSWVASTIVRMMGVDKTEGDAVVSEEEISLMVVEGRQKGVFDATEEKLIKSVFDFADSKVRRAMTPRTDVIGIPLNAGSEQIVRLIVENNFSRYPIFEGSIDQIMGVLHTKDVIVQRLDPKLIILNDLMRPATFVPDSMGLSKLLEEFRRTRNHIAIVLDEFGGTAGIITLQDILEELVGEIQDEGDPEQKELVKHSDKIAFADGLVWPGALNELMDSNLPEDQAETIAGLIIDKLGRFPERNETIEIADMRITILEKDQHRLTRLRLEKTSPSGKSDR